MMKKYPSFADIPALAGHLSQGEVIAFPTDTVFGLACLYDDHKAMEKIYAMKGRSFDKPLAMLCDSLETVKRYAELPWEGEVLAKKFWPGALTLILKKKGDEDKALRTIGVRIPAKKGIQSLIKALGKPLWCTSANRSGEAPLKEAQKVAQTFEDLGAIVMEDAQGELASTVISLVDGLKVIRSGLITAEMIEGELLCHKDPFM